MKKLYTLLSLAVVLVAFNAWCDSLSEDPTRAVSQDSISYLLGYTVCAHDDPNPACERWLYIDYEGKLRIAEKGEPYVDYSDTNGSVMMPPSDEDPQCVKQSEAIEAWESALNVSRTNNPNFATLECDPCKCPSDGWGVDCWQFMASQAQAEKDEHNRQVELLERAKAHGICKEEP